MDPRVARSRTQLQDALLALTRTRSLDDITVADITTAAGVNRSTFYQHYPDKDALLSAALQDKFEETMASLRENPPLNEPGPVPEEMLAYLHHVHENAALYRRIMDDPGSAVVAARLRDHIGALAADIFAQVIPEGWDQIPNEVVGEAFGGTAWGVVTAWLRRDPLAPVDTVAKWLWEMLTGRFDNDFC